MSNNDEGRFFLYCDVKMRHSCEEKSVTYILLKTVSKTDRFENQHLS